ncbi:MAG: DegV family protein [Coriobacteriia bacterium]|nr:DegV family protein [Coriobacteriia bacterium]
MPEKRAFAVVTDSTADIAADIARAQGIIIVPLAVTFGTETFVDGELSQNEFFSRMTASAQLPTTSQPSPGAFAEAFEQALETAESVISVNISDKLSGTIESARQAAADFSGRVHVFDSLNLSWGLGLQVMEAARCSKEGMSADAALARLAEVRDRVRLIVALDSLDNLARGGRIGRVSAFLGSMLNLKVTLTVDSDGAFQPVARTRGEKAALEHTLEWVAEKMGTATRGSFAVGYAMHRERAEKLADEIRARYEVDELVVYEAGIVICTHTGTGWGVAVLPAG